MRSKNAATGEIPGYATRWHGSEEIRNTSRRSGELQLTAVVEVIQRADATAPTTTTERKRNAALVLDSAAVSTAPRRQSAAVAMGFTFFWPPESKKKPLVPPLLLGTGSRKVLH